jgi:tetratricopeptide (TPR) repeat protein
VRRPGKTVAAKPGGRPSLRAFAVLAAVGLSLLILGAIVWLSAGGWSSWLRARAESAAEARDWPRALANWRGYHEVAPASADTMLSEARAALANDRLALARGDLERATALDPRLAAAWLVRLDLLRVEDRSFEALRLAREALEAVAPGDRRPILARATLAALAELPDDEARSRVARWLAVDPGNVDAQVARLVRLAANPHPDDPPRAERIAELSVILQANPKHVPAREALVNALADAGEVDRGREALDGWPEAERDARYDRLRARWDLDYDHQPARAAEGYARALVDLPHDWKSHYGLARALRALGRDREATREAEVVSRLRERLEPRRLGQRLSGDLANLDEPRAAVDLADLCAGVGLSALADAWRIEAASLRGLTSGR